MGRKWFRLTPVSVKPDCDHPITEQTVKKKRRTKPQGSSRFYAQVWRVVDGAVADAFRSHPDYLARHEKMVRASINKRVVGALLGFVEQSTQGRSGKPAAVEPLPGNVGVAAEQKATAWHGEGPARVSPQQFSEVQL